MPIADFDRRKHGAYVYSYFAMGSGETRERLDELFEAGARCAVAYQAGAAPPNDLAAFAIVSGALIWRGTPPGEGRIPIGHTEPIVVWCHTKPPGRKRGLMRALLFHLGVDIEKPMTAMFWSPAIPTMRRRGFTINPPKETRDARDPAEREGKGPGPSAQPDSTGARDPDDSRDIASGRGVQVVRR